MPEVREQNLAPTMKAVLIVSILTLIAVFASIFVVLKADKDTGFEPPYFRRLRLLNESKSDLHGIKVEVQKAPAGPWEDITPSLNPVAPAPLPDGWVWAPDDNPNPVHVFGIQVTAQAGTNPAKTSTVDLPGVADAEVLCVVDEDEVLWLYVAYTFAGGKGMVTWDDSTSP